MIEIVRASLPQKGKAELHAHSCLSHDVKNGRSPQEIADIAYKTTNLTALAITDHNNLDSYYIVDDYSRRNNLPIEIIPGEEIATSDGHIVALYIEQAIEPGLSAIETVQQIHRQNGLAIAAHPYYMTIGSPSLGERGVLSVMESLDPKVYWDGIEVWNASAGDVARSFPNERALAFFFAHKAKLGAPIASSDSHGILIGRAVTSYGEDLKQSIKEGKTGALILDPDETRSQIENYLERYDTKDLRVNLDEIRAKYERHRRSRIRNELAVAVKTGWQQSVDTSFLSDQEGNRFSLLKEARKLGWISSRLALKKAYSQITGFPEELFPVITVANKPGWTRASGPPFITTNPTLYCALSHSGSLGIGVVSINPVAVDVEQVVERDRRSLEYNFTREEIAAEDGLSYDELMARLWVLKEGVMKATQIGLKIKGFKIKLTRYGKDTYLAEAAYGEHRSNWVSRVFRWEDYYFSVTHQLGCDYDIKPVYV